MHFYVMYLNASGIARLTFENFICLHDIIIFIEFYNELFFFQQKYFKIIYMKVYNVAYLKKCCQT